MRFWPALLFGFAALATNVAHAQTCKDMPGLLGQIQAGMKKASAETPAGSAVQPIGGSCPTLKDIYGAVNTLLTTAANDPRQCGALPKEIAKMRELKQAIDQRTDCGKLGL